MTMGPSTIKQYGEKRDFRRTPEPPAAEQASATGPLIFVVQKHRASHLHYDFRLELDGVLKSWAIPKGPSLDPGEKRLAVMVEDHPIDYASFEGTIPKGEYGAGQVIVWDCGMYSPDEGGVLPLNDRAEAEEQMRHGLAAGKLSITLLGEKLKGSWTLVKLKRGERDWLLIKHKDGFADPEREILAETQSVLSGLGIEDLQGGRLPPARPGGLAVRPADLPDARPAPMPITLPPMLASLTDRPFSDSQWLFEPKLDGVRTIAMVRDGGVRIHSRSKLDDTRKYPSLVEALQAQAAREMVLDGEIVALDKQGRPSFQLLQQRMHLTRAADIRRAEAQVPVVYYVFDILYLDGYVLYNVPLAHRKNLLRRVLLPSDHIRLVEHFEEDGEAAYEAAIGQGLEGVIAKRRDSLYEAGRRSRSWLKIKAVLSDEFIIGGFTRGAGARSGAFGALLLGQRDENGRLVYTSHVGTGFTERSLAELRRKLDSMAISDCPFAERPPRKGPTTWVRPDLVAEIKFASWTADGSLRAPVFLYLAEDKPVEDVVRAEVVPAPEQDKNFDNTETLSQHRDVASVLEQLRSHSERIVLEMQEGKLPLNNLEKELWPPHGDRPALVKRDLLRYLAEVSPYLLPHLRDRPLTLTRFPDGVSGQYFFQKHWDGALPDFVETVRLFSEHNSGDQDYLLCNNLPTLLWLGQIANLELHTWFSRTNPNPDGGHLSTGFTGSIEAMTSSLLNYPDFVVFDIDPYIYSGHEPAGAEPELNRRAFDATCKVAMWLKDVLDSLTLASFLKTSGRTGLHIYVPILRRLDFEAVHSIARTIGGFLLKQHPREITMEWAVARRYGKVFLDYNQNLRGKTLASIYSPRAMPEATVSMPLRWEELGSIYPTDFTILNAPDRLAQLGDLWAGILDAKRDLAGLLAGGGPVQQTVSE